MNGGAFSLSCMTRCQQQRRNNREIWRYGSRKSPSSVNNKKHNTSLVLSCSHYYRIFQFIHSSLSLLNHHSIFSVSFFHYLVSKSNWFSQYNLFILRFLLVNFLYFYGVWFGSFVEMLMFDSLLIKSLNYYQSYRSRLVSNMWLNRIFNYDTYKWNLYSCIKFSSQRLVRPWRLEFWECTRIIYIHLQKNRSISSSIYSPLKQSSFHHSLDLLSNSVASRPKLVRISLSTITPCTG